MCACAGERRARDRVNWLCLLSSLEIVPESPGKPVRPLAPAAIVPVFCHFRLVLPVLAIRVSAAITFLFVRVSNVSVFVCFQTRHKASWWESHTWWWSINSGYCSAVAVMETQGAATRFWSSSSCPFMYMTLKVLAPEARWLHSIWSFGILRIFGFWPCDSLKALEMILNLLIYFKMIAFQVFRKLLLINTLKPSSGSQSANFLGVP